MKNAVPKNDGTISGRYVPYQPIFTKNRNCGMMSACQGISIVTIRM